MSDKNPVTGPESYPEPRFDDGALTQVASTKASRRQFIKGVIASGAVASSGAVFLTACGPGEEPAATASAGGVERLLSLNINGQVRRVDVLPNETLAMTLRYVLILTGT